jgi:hypothetical protein
MRERGERGGERGRGGGLMKRRGRGSREVGSDGTMELDSCSESKALLDEDRDSS